MSPLVKETQERILPLLQDLPPASLLVVEQFVRFVHSQIDQGLMIETVARETNAPYLYPTIAVSASTLASLAKILPEGYVGDALADSEALYDET